MENYTLIPDGSEDSEPSPPYDFEKTPKDESGYSIGRPSVEKVRYTHDAMIDVLITNPAISQGAIAKHFGYTQAWVCTIFSSEAFQKRLQERREELIDPAILTSIEDRFKALAQKSLEKLMEHLDRPQEMIDPEIMIKAAALGAKSIGLGLPKQEAPQGSTEDRLKDLSWKLTRLLHKSKEDSGIVDANIINPSGE